MIKTNWLPDMLIGSYVCLCIQMGCKNYFFSIINVSLKKKNWYSLTLVSKATQ